jgi:hypothetical protein
MSEVSTLRLYLLRATYLLILVGMGLQIWPLILQHPSDLEHYRGVTRSLIGGVTLLCALGIRYPLRMLPLLLFELVWKTTWVLSFGLPAWQAHQMTPDMQETMKACLMGVVIFPLVIPWGYVWANYVKAPGDRWRTRPGAAPAAATGRASGTH